jgi:hypothetical protein
MESLLEIVFANHIREELEEGRTNDKMVLIEMERPFIFKRSRSACDAVDPILGSTPMRRSLSCDTVCDNLVAETSLEEVLIKMHKKTLQRQQDRHSTSPLASRGSTSLSPHSTSPLASRDSTSLSPGTATTNTAHFLDDEVGSSDHFKRPSSGSSTGASLPRNSLADEFGYMAEDVASADEFCYVAHELDEYSAAKRGIQSFKLPRCLAEKDSEEQRLQLRSSAHSTATTDTATDNVGASEHFKRSTLATRQDRTPSPVLRCYYCPVLNTPQRLEQGDVFEKLSDADALTAAANKCHGQERGRRKHRQEGNDLSFMRQSAIC